jgi:hypothetical protein
MPQSAHHTYNPRARQLHDRLLLYSVQQNSCAAAPARRTRRQILRTQPAPPPRQEDAAGLGQIFPQPDHVQGMSAIPEVIRGAVAPLLEAIDHLNEQIRCYDPFAGPHSTPSVCCSRPRSGGQTLRSFEPSGRIQPPSTSPGGWLNWRRWRECRLTHKHGVKPLTHRPRGANAQSRGPGLFPEVVRTAPLQVSLRVSAPRRIKTLKVANDYCRNCSMHVDSGNAPQTTQCTRILKVF